MPKIDPRRLDEVENRYIKLLQPTLQIEREVAAQFGASRRQVRRYIAIIRKRIADKRAQVSPEERRAELDALLRRAYDTAEIGSEKLGPNASAMVQAVRVMGELDGLMAPKKFELTAKVDVSADAILREIQAAISAVPAKGDEPRGLLEAEQTDPAGVVEAGEGSQGDE